MKNSDFILMHGKALDGSGKMKEIEVHPDNVDAFKASGYVEGGLPKAKEATPEPTKTPIETPVIHADSKGKVNKK